MTSATLCVIDNMTVDMLNSFFCVLVFDRWGEKSTPNAAAGVDTYPIPYRADYEPYVIMSTQRFVAYDERLRGYGQNKVIQLKWLISLKSTLHVLPGHFLAADYHPNTETSYKIMKTTTRDYVFRTSRAASQEMTKGRRPQVSAGNAALLAAAGFGHSFQHT